MKESEIIQKALGEVIERYGDECKTVKELNDRIKTLKAVGYDNLIKEDVPYVQVIPHIVDSFIAEHNLGMDLERLEFYAGKLPSMWNLRRGRGPAAYLEYKGIFDKPIPGEKEVLGLAKFLEEKHSKLEFWKVKKYKSVYSDNRGCYTDKLNYKFWSMEIVTPNLKIEIESGGEGLHGRDFGSLTARHDKSALQKLPEDELGRLSALNDAVKADASILDMATLLYTPHLPK